MQIALKSSEKFALAAEVTRLEIASIKPNSSTNGATSKVEHVNEQTKLREKYWISCVKQTSKVQLISRRRGTGHPCK